MLILLLATIIFVPMVFEWWVSLRNERQLRAMGAVEPADDVYPWMQVAYPLSFVLILAAAWRGAPPVNVAVAAGFAIFLGAKLLKYWAIATLGVRWTFRVLVPPGSATITAGPYRTLRHPNYIAVLGEIAGAATIAQTPVVGTAVFATFATLILLRVRVEERALGLRPGG